MTKGSLCHIIPIFILFLSNYNIDKNHICTPKVCNKKWCYNKATILYKKKNQINSFQYSKMYNLIAPKSISNFGCLNFLKRFNYLYIYFWRLNELSDVRDILQNLYMPSYQQFRSECGIDNHIQRYIVYINNS